MRRRTARRAGLGLLLLAGFALTAVDSLLPDSDLLLPLVLGLMAAASIGAVLMIEGASPSR